MQWTTPSPIAFIWANSSRTCGGLGPWPVLAAELHLADDARRRLEHGPAVPDDEPLDAAEVDVLH